MALKPQSNQLKNIFSAFSTSKVRLALHFEKYKHCGTRANFYDFPFLNYHEYWNQDKHTHEPQIARK